MTLLKSLTLLIASSVCVAAVQSASDDNFPRHRDGVILLRFVDGLPTSQQNRVLSTVQGRLTKRIGNGINMVDVGSGRVVAALAILRGLAGIKYAEPDYQTEPLNEINGLDATTESSRLHDTILLAPTALQASIPGSIPNDLFWGLQWADQNTGQTVNGIAGVPGSDERAVPAWSISTGSDAIVVAVLDVGVQYSHPDLLTNMWSNPGGINGCAAGTHGYNVLTGNCDPMDDDTQYGGHGSHVAGIVGAVGNDAAGVAGINWTTSIMAVKWVDQTDSGYTSDLITAMDWVVNAKKAGVNVRVINDSQTWPGTAVSQALSDEIDLLTSNDILFVTAAGNTAQNNDTTPRYPCSYNRPGEICVAASDQFDNLWSSSDYGPNTVQLAAGGVNIYSTKRFSNYGYISGTSMAAPQVAGAATLILSRGYLSVADLKAAILNNVDVLPSLTGMVSTGGRLNICQALPGCSSASTATPANQAAPVVTGTPQFGSVLAASTGLWSGAPASFTYQWYRCSGSGANCSAVPGANSQLYGVLASADNGATFAVRVTASNSSGSAFAQSAASRSVNSATSPFSVNSSITDGQAISGNVTWQANPAQGVNFVQFYIDGVLIQTVSSSPYKYNQTTTGVLDTSTLSNGSHVLGIRTLSTDNETYAFYGATVSVGATGGFINGPSTSVQGSGVSSLSATFPSTNTAGRTILAFVRMSTATQTVTVTDTNGNAYQKAISQVQSTDGHQIYLFYAPNIQAGPDTVTARFSGTNNHPWLAISEIGGLSASPLDAVTSAQGSGSSVNIGPTAMTRAANEFVFVGAGFNTPSFKGTVTAGSGFTLGQQNTNTSRAATESTSLSAPGTSLGTFSLSTAAQWSGIIATFLPAGTAAPLAITTTSLPNGQQNGSYSATLSASGGTPPYTWSIVSGSLPAGLGLTAGTGVISGTVTSSGTFNFTAQVQDNANQITTQPLSLVIGASGGNAISVIQSTSIQGSAVMSVSAAFPASNTAGNTILAFVRMSTTTQTISITDSAGNSYLSAVSQVQNMDGHQIHLFYAKSIAGGANTVTATFSAANNHSWLAIYEIQGLSATAPLDKTASAQGSSSSVNTGPTPTTQNANEFVFVGAGFNTPSFTGTVSSGSGYTLGQQNSDTSRAATEYKTVSTTGSYTGNFTLSSPANWSALVATFTQ